VVARPSNEGNPKPAKSLLRRGFLNPLSPPVAIGLSKEASGMAPPSAPMIRVSGVDLNIGLAPGRLPRPEDSPVVMVEGLRAIDNL
jgi:hypothetical protein